MEVSQMGVFVREEKSTNFAGGESYNRPTKKKEKI